MSPLPRQSRRGLCLVPALVVLVLAAAITAIATADDAGEAIRLEYSAGPGCPDEAAFVARLRARTALARFVGRFERARAFVVRLASGATSSGSVTVTDADRGEGTRSLDADTCDEVADALALMVALAIDPHASIAPVAPPASAGSASPDSDSGATPASTAPFADAAPPPLPLPPPPPPAPLTTAPTTDEADAAAAHGSSSALRHVFAGADFAVATGVTPTTLLAGSPYIGWRSTQASLLGVSVRGAFLRAATAALDVPTGGQAIFTWTVGRLDGCAVLWPDRALRLDACARIEAGALDGTGEQIVGARTRHGAWLAAGPLARLEWSLLRVLELDVGVGPVFRTLTNRYYFLPGATVYQVPVTGLDAEAGLGVHFP
jgi:hypothetical protein